MRNKRLRYVITLFLLCISLLPGEIRVEVSGKDSVPERIQKIYPDYEVYKVELKGDAKFVVREGFLPHVGMHTEMYSGKEYQLQGATVGGYQYMIHLQSESEINLSELMGLVFRSPEMYRQLPVEEIVEEVTIHTLDEDYRELGILDFQDSSNDFQNQAVVLIKADAERYIISVPQLTLSDQIIYIVKGKFDDAKQQVLYKAEKEYRYIFPSKPVIPNNERWYVIGALVFLCLMYFVFRKKIKAFTGKILDQVNSWVDVFVTIWMLKFLLSMMITPLALMLEAQGLVSFVWTYLIISLCCVVAFKTFYYGRLIYLCLKNVRRNIKANKETWKDVDVEVS